jgi:hypothetical protein
MLDVRDKIKSFIIDYFVKDSGLVLDDDLSFLEKGIIDSTVLWSWFLSLKQLLISDWKTRR